MATLLEIRAKLKAESEKGKSGTGASTDTSVYAHWNIPDNSTATVRFLADKDTTNSFFWVERNMIKLPFRGIKGQDDSKSITVQVPCMEMWRETCPILAEVRNWFKDKSLEDMGRKYWKKRSYIFQGFIVDSPMKEEVIPENPIRRLVINPQIFNVIKGALMDPEMEELPTDIKRGLDFRIIKGSKGQYADYGTSTWARRERPLNDQELEAIEKFGLFNLKDFLPKKPTTDELKLIKEMFESSVNGDNFDSDKFGMFYKSYDRKTNSTAETDDADLITTNVTSNVVKPEVRIVENKNSAEQTTPISQVIETKKPGGARAEDILKMIRDRQPKS